MSSKKKKKKRNDSDIWEVNYGDDGKKQFIYWLVKEKASASFLNLPFVSLAIEKGDS